MTDVEVDLTALLARPLQCAVTVLVIPSTPVAPPVLQDPLLLLLSVNLLELFTVVEPMWLCKAGARRGRPLHPCFRCMGGVHLAGRLLCGSTYVWGYSTYVWGAGWWCRVGLHPTVEALTFRAAAVMSLPLVLLSPLVLFS